MVLSNLKATCRPSPSAVLSAVLSALLSAVISAKVEALAKVDVASSSVGWVSGIPLTIHSLRPSILHPRFVCGLPRHLHNARFMILPTMILPSAAPLPTYHLAFCIYHCLRSVSSAGSCSNFFFILHFAFCISRKRPLTKIRTYG